MFSESVDNKTDKQVISEVTNCYFALDFNGTRDSRKLRSVCKDTRVASYVKQFERSCADKKRTDGPTDGQIVVAWGYNYVSMQHNCVRMWFIYVNLQHNSSHMKYNYVYMPHDYVIIWDNYVNLQLKLCCNRRGGVEVERSPRIREIRVQSPVATDVKTGSDSSTAKRSATGVSDQYKL